MADAPSPKIMRDVGSRGSLGVEVPPDYRIELLKAFESGEVEIRKTIRGKRRSCHAG
jgi:hypothetical protein